MKELNEINKKYQIIYADPPWKYSDTQKTGGTAYFGACVRYNLMDLKDIKNLPVQNISDNDCTLFLWAVSPLIPEAIDVISSWGFKYKTVDFCWSKITKNYIRVSNMGRWTMGNIELCLLGKEVNHKELEKISNKLLNLLERPTVRNQTKSEIE